jgi:phosphoglycolate phosphatase-like HAD superfamily hydrolase
MKLLIFDIDGTLTHLDGATRRAFNLAFLKVFHVEAVTADLKLHGRTDPVIFQDCFRSTGLTGEWEESFARFRDAYVEALPDAIAASPRVHLQPGVQELLDKLVARRDHAALALGTGNMESGARVKIGRFDLNRYFPVGGFGDVHCERPDIMRDAVKNAEAYYGRKFDPRKIWVIGDTPHDIEGGKAIQACTMGVATGGAYGSGELVAAGADVVFEDLSNTELVLHTFGLD